MSSGTTKVPQIRSALLRYVLRRHKCDLQPREIALQNVISQELPGDDFSLSQWQLGLNYYRRRLSDMGFKGGVLLDVGCGSGNWSMAAASDVRLVIGCDRFGARLSCCRRIRDSLESQNATFLQGDAMALPLQSASVDWCLVYNVLPYVRRWREVVHELARVLRPGGKVFAGWADAGTVLFSLADALVLGRARRLMEVLWMVGGKTLRRMGAYPRLGPGFLGRNDVVYAFARANFHLLASPWARDSHWIERGLFPNKFALLPFFHEAVFAKSLAATSTLDMPSQSCAHPTPSRVDGPESGGRAQFG